MISCDTIRLNRKGIVRSGNGHRWRLIRWTDRFNRKGQRLGVAMCLDCQDLTDVIQCEVPGQNPVFLA